tara:strand:+ start:11208 stop:11393 length:186 start_codon:yes stop_codon:yes gene_type:complete
MKRIGNLFEPILFWQNLEHALRRALRGKRSRDDAQTFSAGMPDSLEEVGERLRSRSGPVVG